MNKILYSGIIFLIGLSFVGMQTPKLSVHPTVITTPNVCTIFGCFTCEYEIQPDVTPAHYWIEGSPQDQDLYFLC